MNWIDNLDTRIEKAAKSLCQCPLEHSDLKFNIRISKRYDCINDILPPWKCSMHRWLNYIKISSENAAVSTPIGFIGNNTPLYHITIDSQ